MKRLLCVLLCLLLLTGCTTPPPADTAPPETTAPAETTAPIETTVPTVPPATVSAQVLALREDLPAMDGSTSLIPLEAGIRAAIFDISMEEATAQVAHSSTWTSFHNLLYGSAELIFSCPLSDEQNDIAAAQGVKLETVPVAMEGFVFVVNAKNPVDSLTQQQLKDIYSGKITNWAQVGGSDLPIIPYQRNYDSGSQNYMIDFMGDTPLMEAPLDWRPATMEGLMDVVAVNDNAAGAIGYSVYAYAADMYGNGDEIKFIQVDGVAPDKNTMAAGEYPLLGKNYAIFKADEPADSNVRTLVDWMTSYDGQLAIARAGYVTLEDIGFDYQEQRLALWQGTGSGPAAEAPDAYEWDLTQIVHNDWGDEYSELLATESRDGSVCIVGLTDEKLTAEINAFIADQLEWIPAAHRELTAWAELQNRGTQFGQYASTVPWEISAVTPKGTDYSCFVTAKNGYLSVAVSVCGSNNRMGSAYLPWRTETATWDLLTGKRLAPEELFCAGVDIDEVLNGLVRSYSLTPMDSWGVYPDMKQDFLALPMTGWHLTHDAIYIDHDNPWFVTGERIPLENLPDGTLVTEQARDFGDRVLHRDLLVHRSWRMSDRDIRYAYNSDQMSSCGFLKEEVHPNAAKINKEVLDHLNTWYTLQAVTDFYSGHGVAIEDVEIWMTMDWDLWNLGGKYLMFQGGSPYHMTDDPNDQIAYPAASFLLYDLDSGEQVPWTRLVKENWREAVPTASKSPEYVEVPLPDKELTIDAIYPQRDGSLDVTLLDGNVTYSFLIPADYVNYD